MPRRQPSTATSTRRAATPGTTTSDSTTNRATTRKGSSSTTTAISSLRHRPTTASFRPARSTTRSRTRPARAGDPDLAVGVWGTTAGIAPGSTRALQTNDNVGVQYGLNALLSSAINPEEFVTLNEGVGGSDADSNPTAARSVADAAALPIAYKSGILS